MKCGDAQVVSTARKKCAQMRTGFSNLVLENVPVLLHSRIYIVQRSNHRANMQLEWSVQITYRIEKRTRDGFSNFKFNL